MHSLLIFCLGVPFGRIHPTVPTHSVVLIRWLTYTTYTIQTDLHPSLHTLPLPSFLLSSPFPLTCFPFDVSLCRLLIRFLLSARAAWVFRWSKISTNLPTSPSGTSASSFWYNFFVWCDKSTVHYRKTNDRSMNHSLCPCPHMDMDVYLSFGT